jgi:hypothetical protein
MATELEIILDELRNRVEQMEIQLRDLELQLQTMRSEP